MGVCGDGEQVAGVVVVIMKCLYEIDSVEGATDVLFKRNGNHDQNQSNLFVDTVYKYGRFLCEAKKRGECRDPSNVAKAGRVGLREENEQKL